MGIENREYMRDGTSSHYRGGSPAMQNIVKTLVIVNVLVFIAQNLLQAPISVSDFPRYYNTKGATQEQIQEAYLEVKAAGRLPQEPLLNQWFTLDSTKVFQGQIWRLTTYDFLHSTESIWHIFFNMWLLYLAGKPVADKYGHREFLWFYLVAGVFSAVFYIVWGAINREAVAAVGASGAVSAILVLYAMNWPHHRWYIYGIIPVPAMLLVLISAGLDLFPMLIQFSGGARTDNIAHSAHIGGMLFGFLYFRQQWTFSSFAPKGFSLKKILSFKRKPNLKIHRPVSSAEIAVPKEPQPIPAHVAQRVDELLEKISRSGEASLTAEERDFLNESSRKYR
ncbi:rhomboid family intramembrane serine protease [Thalassoglobus sp.]|uniref:rhomboid family intramembrane serine protease n=1 Tax=Thalassoglobus sp. TaxID=2795869 RepID=UPI003AA8225E